MAGRILGRVAPLANALHQSDRKRVGDTRTLTAQEAQDASLGTEAVHVRWVNGKLLQTGENRPEREVTGNTDFDR